MNRCKMKCIGNGTFPFPFLLFPSGSFHWEPGFCSLICMIVQFARIRNKSLWQKKNVFKFDNEIQQCGCWLATSEDHRLGSRGVSRLQVGVGASDKKVWKQLDNKDALSTSIAKLLRNPLQYLEYRVAVNVNLDSLRTFPVGFWLQTTDWARFLWSSCCKGWGCTNAVLLTEINWNVVTSSERNSLWLSGVFWSWLLLNYSQEKIIPILKVQLFQITAT